MRGDRNKHGVLRLQFNAQDKAVVHRADDDSELLSICLEDISPSGRVTLVFDGPAFSVWRQKVWDQENAGRANDHEPLNDPLPDF